MDFLTKLKFQLWDDVGVVVGVIGNWRPRGCKDEKSYERSLYAYLHEALGDTQITKQFTQGRLRADLKVGKNVIVELKHNLDSTAKLQRLLGQLCQYEEWEGRVLVLLTGETDSNLLKELKAFIRKRGWDDSLYGEKVTVAEK